MDIFWNNTILLLNNCIKKYCSANSRAGAGEVIFCTFCSIVQFQKISIPTSWKVNGNSEGVGGRVISRGVGGFRPINFL